ncbi:MAG: hypothetical protein SCK28_12515, partial [Bacillota bacterium]|nr:hypothetical protein [Bacillota bacterium]
GLPSRPESHLTMFQLCLSSCFFLVIAVFCRIGIFLNTCPKRPLNIITPDINYQVEVLGKAGPLNAMN